MHSAHSTAHQRTSTTVAGSPEDRSLDTCLAMWADWVHRDTGDGAGYPTETLCSMSGAYSVDFDEALAGTEIQLVEAIEACVDSLPPHEYHAVVQVHVDRDHAPARGAAYLSARGRLKAMLRRRHIELV